MWEFTGRDPSSTSGASGVQDGRTVSGDIQYRPAMTTQTVVIIAGLALLMIYLSRR